MKVALVHDYLKEFGGAERVLLALHEIFPKAPIYTIFCKKGSVAESKFRGVKIIESWFGKIPWCDKLISPLRFLIPFIWMDVAQKIINSDYDLVISSASWAITKGFGGNRIKKGKEKKTVEVCYCHTPPRYLYGYETSRDWQKNIFIRIYAAIVNHFMRLYDFQQAQKVGFFIANSREVQGRIKKFYRRESTVIYPPVEIPKGFDNFERFRERKYFVTGGRLEKPKNFDLIIEACNKLKVPLKIYGVGSQVENLKKMAGPGVEFMGLVTDEEKFKLLSGAKAFIAMAQDEDFGITPVEAMAVGTPVIAYRGGGYLETLAEGKTGIFVDDLTVPALVEAVERYNKIYQHGSFKPENCRKQAENFNQKRFKKKISQFIKKIFQDSEQSRPRK